MADIGKIKNQEITEEMKNSYLAYAMSVIVARALPDVRDGLKPVHRRILYAMNEMGLKHNARLVKSARVVGEVLGKYHPHGDMAVYDSIVRMAQDFSLRYPLIQGQGNWGSVDGDGAAAMRYTEMKMTAIAEELLRDIDKETVSFVDNYDATRTEPTVLPSAIPNLLLNGSVGIAVGMATNIPPHNLSELISAIVHLIDHPKADIDELFEFVKGPDFPTGGLIFNEKEIKQAYVTGKGAILTRANAEIIEVKQGKQILITEIPYQVNKSELIEKMADLVKEKKIEGIRDIRDESGKEGIRITIDLKDSAFPQKVLNNLYKLTDLEKYFHMHLLALVDGGIQPQTLSLKSALEEYIKHREVVVTKRTQFDLSRTKERIHILEGLKKALDHIDAVIQTIKKSKDRNEAHVNLIKKFKFSDLQATAILEMRLQTLAGLERQKIDDELKEKLALARELESILKDQKRISGVIKKELLDIQQKYGDERRTKVVKYAAREIAEEDLIPEEEAIIVVTRGGYIKRLKPETYRVQRRGGKGIIGMETKEEDMVEHFLMANTHSDLLFFTNSGKVFQIKAYEVPEGSRISKGKAIHNFLSIGTDEFITSVLAASKKSSKKEKESRADGASYAYLMMATKHGIMKKVEATSFESVRRSGLIAITLKKGDLLKWVRPTFGKDEAVVVTRAGQAIRFSEKDVRSMGRSAAGVRAIKLKKKDDEVVGMDIVVTADAELVKKAEMLVMMENGYGKRTPLKEYKRQHRGGSGIKTAKVTAKNGAVIMTKILIGEETEIIAISRKGQVIRTEISAIPTLGRATQGVRIMKLAEGDKLASITTL